MSTGDIKGNIAHLQRCLQHVKYPSAVDEIGLTVGDPLAALPILNFVLLKYSRHVATYIVTKGIQLQGKTDDGFVKNVFRLFRDHLGLRVIITPAQFLEQGYAERKVLLLIDAVRAVRAIHQIGVKQEKTKIDNAWRQSPKKQQQAPASPWEPATQLRGGQQNEQQLRQVHVTAATDAAQEMYQLMQPEATDLIAAANAALRSPARNTVSLTWRQSNSKASSPGPTNTKGASSNSTGSGGNSLNQHSSQRHVVKCDKHEQHWDVSAAVDDSVLQLRVLQPMPVQQQQWGSSSHKSHSSGASSYGDQLIAVGLMPLPRSPQRYVDMHEQQQQQQQQQHMIQHSLENHDRQVMPSAADIPRPAEPAAAQQQQQRRPLRSCLWPQSQASPKFSNLGSQARVLGDQMHQLQGPSSGIIASNSSSSSSSKQAKELEEQELQGTTTLIAAPESPVTNDAVSEQLATVQQPSYAPHAEGIERLTNLLPAPQQQQQQQQQLVEYQCVVVELQQRLAQAEQQLQEQRAAAARFEEVASARITLLEGRLKFLENMVTSNNQQQQQQRMARTEGLPDSRSRSKASPAALASMSVRSSMACPPAVHSTTGASLPTSPCTSRFMSVVPRTSPARSAAAAAAAVVAGLTGSPLRYPLKSPLKPQPTRGNVNKGLTTATATGSRLWHFRPRNDGLHSSTDNAVDRAARQEQEQEAATAHTVKAQTAESSNSLDMPRQSVNVPDRGNGLLTVAKQGGPDGCRDRGTDLAGAKENRDTESLIDKLAFRAVEAAAMLEAFRTGQML